MGLVNAVYTWGSVKALHYTVFSMNLAGLLALVLAIVWAVRFERGFGDYLNLVTPGDGHVWTTVIISAAIFCAPAYILGAKSWLKLEPARNDLEDQQKMDPHDLNRLLFFHVVACLLSGFLVAILNATYLVLLSGFQQKSRDGLIEAIEKYGSDVAVKARIDAVQTELECCGDNGFEDWFRVPWIKLSVEGPEEAEQGPRLEEQSMSEDQEEESPATADVPFSCCSNDIPKPCVHHDILNPSAIYDYNPKRLTIATLGCRSKIISRGETIKTFLAGYLTLLSVYQMVLSFLARLLQTAHSNEFYIGPQKTRYHVWILFSPDNSRDNVPLIGQTRSKESPVPRKPSNSAESSSSEPSNVEEEIEIPSKVRKTGGAKVLQKLRSKLSNVKAKSLPLIKPSRMFSKRYRRKHRMMSSSSDEEDEEEEKGEARERGRFLSRRRTRSEFKIRDSSSSDNSSLTNLPSPPPPPALVASFKLENEEVSSKVDVPKLSKSGIEVAEPLEGHVIGNQNSGRRVKVLERFGQLWGRRDGGTRSRDRGTWPRQSGGADRSSDSGPSSRSTRSRKLKPSEFRPTDVYDRFRGSLQHTLARREAVRARRGLGRHRPETLDSKRSNVLARLRCDNVPPSYRLLATMDVQRRPSLLEEKPPQTAWTRDSVSRIEGHCSVCRRPVPDNSRDRLTDRRVFEVEERREPEDPPEREPECLRRDYMSWNRSTLGSRFVQRR